MQKDTLSYNPNFHYKDDMNYFKQFLLLQDEVPTNILIVKEDSSFLKNRIIQTRIDKPNKFEKSIFSSHLLKPSSIVIKDKHIYNHTWTSGIIVLCFILFAFARYNYSKRINQIFKAFFANRFFNQLSREGGLFKERVSFILFITYIAALGLFIFQIYCYYNNIILSELISFWMYIKILSGILIFFLIKTFLYVLTGFIFGKAKETSDYLLNIFIFDQIMGVILLPIIVLTTFIHNQYFIYMGVLIFGLLYLYKMYSGAIYAISVAKISPYYLFLYLCTLEILPILILAKIFRIMSS